MRARCAEIEEGLVDPDLVISQEALQAARSLIESLGARAVRLLLAAVATNPNDTVRVGSAMLALYAPGF